MGKITVFDIENEFEVVYTLVGTAEARSIGTNLSMRVQGEIIELYYDNWKQIDSNNRQIELGRLLFDGKNVLQNDFDAFIAIENTEGRKMEFDLFDDLLIF